jgi:signal transduction histidine kinase
MSGWQRFAANAVVLFHEYANWLVSISWKRFFLLSVLLLIASLVLGDLTKGNSHDSEEVLVTQGGTPSTPSPPKTAKSGKREPAIKIEKKDDSGDDVTISIDKDGVRISPRKRPATAAAGAASAAPAASAASASGFAASATSDGVEIKLPAGADSEAVREAVEEARKAVVEAIRESQRATEEAADETAESNEKTVRTIRRIHSDSPPFSGLAWLFIVASAILKITYKGRMQAEVKAAVATETAEAEQLKRQVVEARMAAMQAQVEPHFLFNTLASIDHLIETDPPRASQMQKNLIALLRASMPSMREQHPTAHNLGREMAVIRPYLAILKVRMEDRLQTSVNVPEGLASAEFPSMMIQSLVENAIKHGLEPKAEGGTLTVNAEIVHGKLAVTVADTGLGFGKGDTAGTGIGLTNIRERLNLLYGDRASMVVADNSPTGTIVTLTVPYQAQPMAAGQEGKPS